MKAVKWRIEGLVQGVGFRPFIHRIAVKNGLNGWVENDNMGVLVLTEGTQYQIDAFSQDLYSQKPAPANIIRVTREMVNLTGYSNFSIRKSQSHSDEITLVSPDIAVCDDCLADMSVQKHRIDYPFINCTNCGPRFSIIRALPYDRAQTTMDVFDMCAQCRKEYTDVLDRRFHAQPVACSHCGPAYSVVGDFLKPADIVSAVSGWIDEGQIIALQGVGGFHLLCDAMNEEAVQRLRKAKNRDGKPMAVMMPDMATVEQFFEVSRSEKQSLTSWRRPIVLLRNKLPLSPSVSRGLPTTGIVLPYMPFHYQLFRHLKTSAIVLTSGNVSDEPVAVDHLSPNFSLDRLADHVVFYNRLIHNRADDSVVMIADDKERLLRRSRGYAPEPVLLNLQTEGIFAAGAELVNTFAIGKGNMGILSQHIGDLKNAETLAFYHEAHQRFAALFRHETVLVAADLHPDYLSSRYAATLNMPLIKVQHHHAHIASCMAEHGLDETVIGIALDGTGLGDDGTIWGGEFLLANLTNYERMYWLQPVPLPGGDKVTEEPWRTAVSYLYQYFGAQILDEDLPFMKSVSREKINWIIKAIEKNINSPISSGAGRLFDAVAALTGICTQSSFHAEAPMRLEAAITSGCKSKYLYDIKDQKVHLMKLFYLILKDLRSNVPVGVISARFHNTLLALMLDLAKRLRKAHGVNKVVFSGGSFQNRYLLENGLQMLRSQGFEVFAHEKVPTNDGGIALGQLAVAAKRLSH